jgi:NitT/TauT family transport system substrate-binding protein
VLPSPSLIAAEFATTPGYFLQEVAIALGETVAGSLLAVVASCAFSLFPTAAAEKLVIRMDWVPSGVYAPFHLALRKGWFRDAGIDVELQDRKGSINTLQLLATGEADIGEVTAGIFRSRENEGCA